MSPEMLNECRAGKEADYWGVGCILFQILFGRVPFQDINEHLVFQKILNLQYEFPAGCDKDARDLIS